MDSEKQRIEALRALKTRSGMVSNTSQAEPAVQPQASFGDHLRQRNQVTSQQSFQSYYDGPNINQIRKSSGLRNNVDKVIDSVREDIPSIGHRPSAGVQHGKTLGARSKHQPATSTTPAHREFEEFLAWKQTKVSGAAAAVLDSDSDDVSPPRAIVSRAYVPPA